MITYEMLSKDGGRDHNEDYIGMAEYGESRCFVLADGLGGHGGGDEASKLVTEHILERFRTDGEVSVQYLQECFTGSQELLMKEQERQERTNEMKTTLVVLVMDEKQICWGHVGDSRLYYFKNKKYVTRTLDHSVPQMLVAAGEITEKQIRGHADRNRLLRVMGTEWDGPQCKISEPIPRGSNTAFLLCTDGFWELIDEKKMVSLLKKSDTPKEWLEAMEKEVQKNGNDKNMDNYSAICVFAE